MAITKTSGAIAMSEIQTEFGGSNPISMSEYYGDGSYVSDGAADGDGNAIPESGAISISHFYDTSDCVSFTTAQFRTKGSGIGNMTLAGGLAAAFNNSTSGDWQSGARKDPSDDAYIGRRSTSYSDCNIAQLGIWTRTITQEEIQSIKEKTYSELTTSEKATLVSWWGLDADISGAVEDLD